MAFPFTCPHCGVRTLVQDWYEGRSGPCVGCGKQITATRQPAAAQAPHDVTEAPSPQAVVSILAIILGLLLLTGASVWIGYQMRVLPVSPNGFAQKVQTQDNLRVIATALRAYQQHYGSLPPAMLTDAEGKPMHSWRVLVLPYLGEEVLYAQYRMDEPWDGPNNSLLVRQMPNVFAVPNDPSLQPGLTGFLAITGEGTAFPLEGTVRDNQIVDGLSTTLLVVETTGAQVVWTQPVDLRVTRMDFGLNRRPGQSIGSPHADGPSVLMADGTVHTLPPNTAPTIIQAMTTIAGGETIKLESSQ